VTDINEAANQEKSDPYSLVNKVINDTDAFYAELQKLNTYDGICSYAPELLEDTLSGAKESIHTLERAIALLDEALSFIRQRGESR
jgi:hypothetical protein